MIENNTYIGCGVWQVFKKGSYYGSGYCQLLLLQIVTLLLSGTMLSVCDNAQTNQLP